jgi:hypothetical protein
MNERIGNSKIYALAKEAGLIEDEQFAWNPELGSPTYESVAKARKFAELIVAECVKLQYKNVIVGGVSDYNMGRRELAEDIQKHFGVEE